MSTLRRAHEIDADNPVEGDLYISTTGQLVLVGKDGVDRDLEVRQHVRSRLRFFLGEWFLDERQGFPYFRDVFIKNPNRQSIVSSLRRTIRQTPGVAEVDELTLQVDEGRRASVSFRAILEDSAIPLVFEDFILGEF
jgi:hypothetical protein